MEWTTRALIDTGAPQTIFDRGVADALLINVGRAGAITGNVKLLGVSRILQFEDVELSLTHEPQEAWTARVGFITDPTFQMPFQAILGTEGFLDRWAVLFNKAYDYFDVMRPDDAWPA